MFHRIIRNEYGSMTLSAGMQEAEDRRQNGTLLPSYLTVDQMFGNTSVEEEYVTAAGNVK